MDAAERRHAGDTPAFAAPSIEKSKFGRPPAWFVHLIGVSPETEQIPIAVGDRDYGTIVIETDPYNETLEVWNEFAGTLATLAVFGGLTILLIYVFIGRTLRPLERKSLQTLNLRDGATRIEIKARFKELVKVHHPDTNGGDARSADKLREIIQAYNYLKQAGMA